MLTQARSGTHIICSCIYIFSSSSRLRVCVHTAVCSLAVKFMRGARGPRAISPRETIYRNFALKSRASLCLVSLILAVPSLDLCNVLYLLPNQEMRHESTEVIFVYNLAFPHLIMAAFFFFAICVDVLHE